MDALEKIQQDISDIKNSIAAQKEVVTMDGAVLVTGLKESYLYKLSATGEIPCSKPLGKRLYFSRSQLEAWLMSRPVKSSAAIDTEAATFVTLKKRRVAK